MPTFSFDPQHWVFGDVRSPGEWSPEDRAFIERLRTNHPELEGWGDAAVGFAWGSFSEDVMLTSWVDWITDRWPAFLAYLYVKKLRPSFDFGRTGGYDRDLDDMAESKPWLIEGDHAPEWANH